MEFCTDNYVKVEPETQLNTKLKEKKVEEEFKGKKNMPTF